jgi:hypothetical protein
VWTHVAVQVQKSTAKVSFFFNGTAVGAHTLAAGSVVIHAGGGSGSVALSGKGDACAVCGAYTGLMDEVRVWDSWLDAAGLLRSRTTPLASHPAVANLKARYVAADASMRVSYNAALAPATTMTFEAWIKPAVGSKSQTLVALGGTGWRVMLMCGGSANSCCGSHIANSIGFWMGDTPTGVAAGSECSATPSSTTAVTIGQWSHIAVQVDLGPKTVTFVINAVTSNSVTHAGLKISDGGASDGAMTFGYLGSCNCMRYDGFLDGVRIWKTKRTLAEIQLSKVGLYTN